MIIIDSLPTLSTEVLSEKEKARIEAMCEEFRRIFKESGVKLIILPNPYDHPIL